MPLQMRVQLLMERLGVCCRHYDCELYRASGQCAVEHRFKHNPDLERLILDTGSDRQLQHNGKYDPVLLQM